MRGRAHARARARLRARTAECGGAARRRAATVSSPCARRWTAQVYLVRHAGDGRNYVLKVIKLRGIPAKERAVRQWP